MKVFWSFLRSTEEKMLSLEHIKKFYADPGISERNMVREYLQYKILEIVFDLPAGEKLNFVGGTAIRIIHGGDRFSEDLDFDNFDLTRDEFVSMAESVGRRLEKEGFRVETNHVFHEGFRGYLKFPGLLYDYGLTGHRQEKVVIQLDTADQDYPVGVDQKIINKFGVFSQVRVNPVEVLLSQKLTAILGRKRVLGRDLYDTVYLGSLTSPNFEYLGAKMGIRRWSELVGRIKERLVGYDPDQLAQDIAPFVSNAKRLRVVRNFVYWLEEWSKKNDRGDDRKFDRV